MSTSITDILGYNTASTTKSTTTASNTELDMNDYLKLLVAQLSNQDSSNPMETSEMVAQLAQMATVQAMSSFETMSNNSYATSLLGKQVVVTSTSVGGKYQGLVSGTVNGVTMSNGKASILVDGIPYELTSVVSIAGADQTESGSSAEGPGEAAAASVMTLAEEGPVDSKITNKSTTYTEVVKA